MGLGFSLRLRCGWDWNGDRNGSRGGRIRVHFRNGIRIQTKIGIRTGLGKGRGQGMDAAGNETGMPLLSTGVALRMVTGLVATFTVALEVVAAVAG